MKKALLFACLVPFMMQLGCTKNNNSSEPGNKDQFDTFDTTDLDNNSDDDGFESLYPQTGLNLSSANGDYNIVDVEQILVFGYGLNITRMVSENRYYRDNGRFVRPVGCDVFYYTNDRKSLGQIARENNMSLRDTIVEIASGEGVRLFGGEYNRNGGWYFQDSFKSNQRVCSQSIFNSRLMDDVYDGTSRIIFGRASESAKNQLNR